MRTRRTLLTAEELLSLSTTGRRLELVTGELFETPPAGASHGSVAMEIGLLLGSHVNANQLGEVFSAGTGFVLRRDPDTVRAPDASFVARERLPADGPPTGFLDVAPDPAVEVVSPGDTKREVEDKVADWLRARTHVARTIYPATRSVTVYCSLEDVRALSEADTLAGDEVVPGFACKIRDLFAKGAS